MLTEQNKKQQFKIRIFDAEGEKFSESDNSDTYETRPNFNTARNESRRQSPDIIRMQNSTIQSNYQTIAQLTNELN